MKTLILNNKQIEQKINRIAYEIYENNHGEKEIIIAGISDNGYIQFRCGGGRHKSRARFGYGNTGSGWELPSIGEWNSNRIAQVLGCLPWKDKYCLYRTRHNGRSRCNGAYAYNDGGRRRVTRNDMQRKRY